MDEKIRQLLRDRADTIGPYPSADPALERRARRRAALTVGTTALAAVLVIAAGALGVRSLRSAPAPELSPKPTPLASYRHNGSILTASGLAIDPVTGARTQLAWPRDVRDLAWSPDGSRLAYTVPQGLFVWTAATEERRPLAGCVGGECPTTVAWSHDGSRIAFSTGSRLETIAPDGSDVTTVTSLPNKLGFGSPSWSPDGRRLVFGQFVGPNDERLVSIAVDGTDMKVLGHAAKGSIGFGDPSWSPDGRTIAYLTTTPNPKGSAWRQLEHVMSVQADGTHPQELLRAGSCVCSGSSPSLAWSPDGRQIALVIAAPGGNSASAGSGLSVMNPDGTGLRFVTAVSGPVAWRPVSGTGKAPQAAPHGVRYLHNGEIVSVGGEVLTFNGAVQGLNLPPGVRDLSWSPDGRQLAFVVVVPGARPVDPANGLFVRTFSLDDRRTLKIAGCDGTACPTGVAWSPNGSRIALSNGSRLQTIAPDGTGLTTLAFFPSGKVGPPSWSPDGGRLVFGYVDSHRDLYSIAADGTDRLLLGRAPAGSIGYLDPTWSPDGSMIGYITSSPAGACTSNPCYNHAGWRYRVVSVRPDGSHAVELSPFPRCTCGFWAAFAWSPDGAQIAFATRTLSHAKDGKGDMYVINLNGRGGLSIPPGPGDLEYGGVVSGAISWRPIP